MTRVLTQEAGDLGSRPPSEVREDESVSPSQQSALTTKPQVRHYLVASLALGLLLLG